MTKKSLIVEMVVQDVDTDLNSIGFRRPYKETDYSMHNKTFENAPKSKRDDIVRTPSPESDASSNNSS